MSSVFYGCSWEIGTTYTAIKRSLAKFEPLPEPAFARRSRRACAPIFRRTIIRSSRGRQERDARLGGAEGYPPSAVSPRGARPIRGHVVTETAGKGVTPRGPQLATREGTTVVSGEVKVGSAKEVPETVR